MIMKKCRCGQTNKQVEYTIGVVDYCPTCNKPVWPCYWPTWRGYSTHEFAAYLVRWFNENYKPGAPGVIWIPPKSED